MKTKKTPSKKPATQDPKPRRLALVPGLARNAPYLTQACYIRELVPLHVIATLSEVDGDAEMKGLCREVTQAMLRLRDKLAGRPVRPNMNSAALGWSYSYYRASLYLDGERFAIVTPDGRNALSKRNAALLLEALNRKPHNEKLSRPAAE